MKRKLTTVPGYRLGSVIASHGWSGLPPFRVEAPQRISFGVRISGGVFDALLTEENQTVYLESRGPIAEIERAAREMFRMDQDLSDFYRHAVRHDRAWIRRKQMGRMLRAQTVFEDLVKMVLTTNCSWSFTQKMVGALVEHLGERTPGGIALFPTPERLVSKREAFFRDTIRAGYRAPHLPVLGRIFARREIDADAWMDPKVSTETIRKEILSLPGAGPYVADNVLKLLGRFDYLGIDSWVRKRLGRDDRAIRKAYEKHGEYRGLVLWCDVTKDWLS